MPQDRVLSVVGSPFVIIRSFVDGDRMVPAPRLQRETEVDAFTRALWLEKHGKPEEADNYLTQFLLRH